MTIQGQDQIYHSPTSWAEDGLRQPNLTKQFIIWNNAFWLVETRDEAQFAEYGLHPGDLRGVESQFQVQISSASAEFDQIFQYFECYFFVNFHSNSGAGAEMEQGKNFISGVALPCSANISSLKHLGVCS